MKIRYRLRLHEKVRRLHMRLHSTAATITGYTAISQIGDTPTESDVRTVLVNFIWVPGNTGTSTTQYRCASYRCGTGTAVRYTTHTNSQQSAYLALLGYSFERSAISPFQWSDVNLEFFHYFFSILRYSISSRYQHRYLDFGYRHLYTSRYYAPDRYCMYKQLSVLYGCRYLSYGIR